MSDSADDLILQMQHLGAQATNSLQANAQRKGLDRLKSSAQKLAWGCQVQIATHEQTISEGEKTIEQLREGGVTPQEAPQFVQVRNAMEEAKKALIKVRAQYQFALDRMDAVERREYLAFHAEVRAETHAHLADGT